MDDQIEKMMKGSGPRKVDGDVGEAPPKEKEERPAIALLPQPVPTDGVCVCGWVGGWVCSSSRSPFVGKEMSSHT